MVHCMQEIYAGRLPAKGGFFVNDQQLLCFLVVSRTLNFSAAARELFITQPALSYQIRSLEKELDVQLFARTTTKVELTAAGRAFEEPARQLYRQLLCARDAVRPFLAKKAACGASARHDGTPGQPLSYNDGAGKPPDARV